MLKVIKILRTENPTARKRALIGSTRDKTTKSVGNDYRIISNRIISLKYGLEKTIKLRSES